MSSMKNSDIGIAILTYNSAHHLPHCLPPLKGYKVLVVDPDSKDDTVSIAKEWGAEVLSIPYREFNHGLTREKARQHLGTDIVVFMTPDAYGKSGFLEKLVAPIKEGKADLAYARQLPKPQASPFEALPRLLNYPESGHIRSWEDRAAWSSFLFFFSDSCSAYSNEALDKIGGFAECLLGEDALACAKILKQGGKVAYVAEAEVYHSHTYSLLQEFRRYFDTGLARRDMAPFLAEVGKDGHYGQQFARKFLSSLKAEELPYGVVQLGAKWLGYQIGRFLGPHLSTRIKKALSSQKFYWDSIPYKNVSKKK